MLCLWQPDNRYTVKIKFNLKRLVYYETEMAKIQSTILNSIFLFFIRWSRHYDRLVQNQNKSEFDSNCFYERQTTFTHTLTQFVQIIWPWPEPLIKGICSKARPQLYQQTVLPFVILKYQNDTFFAPCPFFDTFLHWYQKWYLLQ